MGSTKLASLFPAAAFFLIPFLGGNHLPLSFITVDRFWIENVFLLLLIISAVLIFFAEERKSSGFSKFILLLLPFFTLTALSLVYTWNRFSTMNSISVLVWSTGCVYVYSHSDRRDLLLQTLVVGAALSAICAMIQYKVLFPELLTTFKEGGSGQIVREQGGIPFSSYLHHNMLGGYLAFVLPLALYFAVVRKRLIHMIAVPLMIAGIVLTSTRIGMAIALAAILFAILFLAVRRGWKGLLLLCVNMCVGFLVLFALFSGVRAKGEVGVQNILEQKVKSTYSQLSTVNARTEIWKNGVKAFYARPYAGFGAGAFEYGYRRHFDGGAYTRAAHNTFLKIGVELGLIGILAFVIFLIGTGRVMAGVLKEPLYLFVSLSAVVCFLFGMVDFSFDVRSHVVTFFIFSSAFFGVRREGDHKEERINHRPSVRPFLFLLVVSLLLLVFVFNLRVNLARRSLDDGIVFEENGLFTDAYISYRDAINDMPFENEGYIRAAGILIKSYGNEKVTENREKTKIGVMHYLKRMERITDKDSELYFIMGKGYALEGDKTRAEAFFSKALAYYPSSSYYVYEAAYYLFTEGEQAKAEELIRGFDKFVDRFRTPHNPRGFYVYKIRDLEATIAHGRGDTKKALSIARTNYDDANRGVFVITTARSRAYVERAGFVDYLKGRVQYYESAISVQ